MAAGIRWQQVSDGNGNGGRYRAAMVAGGYRAGATNLGFQRFRLAALARIRWSGYKGRTRVLEKKRCACAHLFFVRSEER